MVKPADSAATDNIQLVHTSYKRQVKYVDKLFWLQDKIFGVLKSQTKKQATYYVYYMK